MNLDQARLGLLVAPPTAVWTGTVVSYSGYALVVSTATGAFPTYIENLLLVRAGVDLVRVRSRASSTLTLAENPHTFTPGDALALYEIRLPWPRYQRIDSGVVYKDYDVAFPATWQHELPPTPLALGRTALNEWGEAIAVATGAEFTLDDAGSYVNVTGGTPLTYAWALGSGGVVTWSSGDGSNILAKYTTAGFRYARLAVTDAHGGVAYRYVPIWVGQTPVAGVTRCAARWDVAQGWTVDVEVQSAFSYLQYSPAIVVDLHSLNVIFFGFVVPEAQTQTFKRTTTRLTLQSALAFTRYLSAYAFIVTDVRSTTYPDNWAEVYSLTLARALWFLIHWHSTLAEVVNWDASGAPARDIAGQEFNLGSLPQQVAAVAKSAFWQARGARAGGVVLDTDPLYLDSTAWAALSGADLTASADLREELSLEYAQPAISQVRLGGVYRTVGGTFAPALVQAPVAPGAWGSPQEINNLAPASEAELQGWAGRHIAVENTADTYAVQPGVGVEPATDLIADLPGSVRIAVERVSLDYQPAQGRWQQQVSGRAYGRAPGAATLPQPPPVVIPPPEWPPLYPPLWPPLPLPAPLEWPTRLYIFTNAGGVYYTADFTPTGTQPPWSAVNTGLEDLRIQRADTDCADPATYQYALGYDTAGELCIYRRVAAGAWTKILTEASAQPLLPYTVATLKDFCADRVIPGRLYAQVNTGSTGSFRYYLLRSDDYGANWLLVCRLPYSTSLYSTGQDLYAADNAVFYVYGSSTSRRHCRSLDYGSSWTRAASAAWAATRPPFAYTLPEATFAHAGYSSNDLVQINWSGSGNVILQDAFELLAHLGGYWISPVVPAWHRTLRCLGTSNPVELLETLDTWSSVAVVSTLATAYAARLAGGMFYVVNAADTEREEWNIVAAGRPDVTYPHTIYALDETNNPGVLTGRAGVSPGSRPYTASIPRTANGVCVQGLQVIA